MDKQAKESKVDFMLTVGDNLYENGIESMTDLTAINKVMSYFQSPNLKNLPMYVTLGNHDCYTDYKNELTYSTINNQWKLPYDYYDLKVPLADSPNKFLVVLVLNPCTLACFKLDNNANKGRCKMMNSELDSKEAYAQKKWLDETLAKYRADPSTHWLAVTTHHPFTTEPSLKRWIIPILQKHKVDVILAGHTHHSGYSRIF